MNKKFESKSNYKRCSRCGMMVPDCCVTNVAIQCGPGHKEFCLCAFCAAKIVSLIRSADSLVCDESIGTNEASS